MLYDIMSDGAVIQIETRGAELQSVKDIFGTEYLWQGNSKYWAGRSPILFPIIGTQKNGEFEYAGNTYPTKNHGFARYSEFEVLRQNKDSILLSLSSNEDTLRIYPFKFSLQVEYALKGTVLEVEYRVANTGKEDMLFSIGGHTGFNCPLLPDENFEDYTVEFEKNETTVRMLLNDKGLYDGLTMPLFDGNRDFRLDHSLFELDAIVPEHLESKSVTLKSLRSGRGVRLDYGDFDNCAVWSARGDAPFVCLEPWNGIASSVDDSGRLEDKKGIIKLSVGQLYRVSHTISLL